jgi:outer membrane protein, multidrug efflux system
LNEFVQNSATRSAIERRAERVRTGNMADGRRNVLVAASIVAACGAGCMPFGRSARPEPPPDFPQTFGAAVPPPAGDAKAPETSAPPTTARREGRAAWWHAFGDPALSALIERALAANYDLRAAFARVDQARAMAVQATAPRWPQVGLQGQATWNQSVNSFIGDSATTTLLRGSLPVSYEVDWFARNAANAEAAELDAEAARADVEAAAVTLAAQVAEAWFDVTEARARRAVLAEQLRINQTFLELTLLRFREGLASALDTNQQRQQVAATRAQIELADVREHAAENRLTVLLGDSRQPGAYYPDREEMPALVGPAAPGMPADLLSQRPDVRAAARRLEAADERVAFALAGRLPALTISGAPGYSWTRFVGPIPGIGGEAHGLELNAGATLTFPVFDGFLRAAQVDQNRARVREAVFAYERALQQAVLEVEAALVQERDQREHVESLVEQLDAARATLESARDRYRQGLSDFLPVLTALQAVQQTELALVSARRQLLSFRVQLHRALGGSWPESMRASGDEEKS